MSFRKVRSICRCQIPSGLFDKIRSFFRHRKHLYLHTRGCSNKNVAVSQYSSLDIGDVVGLSNKIHSLSGIMSYDKKEVECLLCRSFIMEVNFGSHLYDEHGGFHVDDYDDVRGDVRELVNDVSINHGGHGVAGVNVAKSLAIELLKSCLENAMQAVDCKLKDNHFEDVERSDRISDDNDLVHSDLVFKGTDRVSDDRMDVDGYDEDSVMNADKIATELVTFCLDTAMQLGNCHNEQIYYEEDWFSDSFTQEVPSTKQLTERMEGDNDEKSDGNEYLEDKEKNAEKLVVQLVMTCLEDAVQLANRHLEPTAYDESWFDDDFSEVGVAKDEVQAEPDTVVPDEWFADDFDFNEIGKTIADVNIQDFEDCFDEEFLFEEDAAFSNNGEPGVLSSDSVKSKPHLATSVVSNQTYLPVGCLESYITGKSTFVRAIILARSGPRFTKPKKRGGPCRIFSNFTLIDQNSRTVNATVWTETEAEACDFASFHVGEVVQLRNFNLIPRTAVKHDKLDPEVTCSMKLIFVKGKSQLKKVDQRCFPSFEEKVKSPYVGNGIVIDFQDLVVGEIDLRNLVSFSATVTEMSHDIKVGVKQMMTVVLFSQGKLDVKMKLWEQEHRNQAKGWCVGDNVHCSGIKVEKDEYKNSLCFAGNSRTVLVAAKRVIH